MCRRKSYFSLQVPILLGLLCVVHVKPAKQYVKRSCFQFCLTFELKLAQLVLLEVRSIVKCSMVQKSAWFGDDGTLGFTACDRNQSPMAKALFDKWRLSNY